MSNPPKKSVVEQLFSIASAPDASIKRKIARENFGDDYEFLLNVNALNHFKNLKDIEVIDGDHAYTAEIERRDGKNMYFSPSDGWVAVLDEDIALYQINFEWLVRQIMKALGIADRHNPKLALENRIWLLGKHRIEKQNIHIIITRNIVQSLVYEPLTQHLNEQHRGQEPALILTMDMHIPEHFTLPGQNVLVRLEEAMLIESEHFELNLSMLARKMGGSVTTPGFSNGFRTLHSNGKTYQFSKLQSEVMEFMDGQGKPVHQTEILAQTSSQEGNKLRVLFKGKGGKVHEAWNEILKNDGRGNYWLEY